MHLYVHVFPFHLWPQLSKGLAAHEGVFEVGSLTLWAVREVTPLAATHLLKSEGGSSPASLQSAPPHPSAKLRKKGAGSCSNVLISKPNDPNQSFVGNLHILISNNFIRNFNIHNTLYASDTISDTMIHCWLLFISHLRV